MNLQERCNKYRDLEDAINAVDIQYENEVRRGADILLTLREKQEEDIEFLKKLTDLIRTSITESLQNNPSISSNLKIYLYDHIYLHLKQLIDPLADTQLS
jgi:predicted nucleic acid-binding protein